MLCSAHLKRDKYLAPREKGRKIYFMFNGLLTLTYTKKIDVVNMEPTTVHCLDDNNNVRMVWNDSITSEMLTFEKSTDQPDGAVQECLVCKYEDLKIAYCWLKGAEDGFISASIFDAVNYLSSFSNMTDQSTLCAYPSAITNVKLLAEIVNALIDLAHERNCKGITINEDDAKIVKYADEFIFTKKMKVIKRKPNTVYCMHEDNNIRLVNDDIITEKGWRFEKVTDNPFEIAQECLVCKCEALDIAYCWLTETEEGYLSVDIFNAIEYVDMCSLIKREMMCDWPCIVTNTNLLVDICNALIDIAHERGCRGIIPGSLEGNILYWYLRDK